MPGACPAARWFNVAAIATRLPRLALDSLLGVQGTSYTAYTAFCGYLRIGCGCLQRRTLRGGKVGWRGFEPHPGAPTCGAQDLVTAVIQPRATWPTMAAVRTEAPPVDGVSCFAGRPLIGTESQRTR